MCFWWWDDESVEHVYVMLDSLVRNSSIGTNVTRYIEGFLDCLLGFYEKFGDLLFLKNN